MLRGCWRPFRPLPILSFRLFAHEMIEVLVSTHSVGVSTGITFSVDAVLVSGTAAKGRRLSKAHDTGRQGKRLNTHQRAYS